MVQWTEIGMFVSVVAASIVAILGMTMKSRCNTIKCGCITCERDVLPPDEPRVSNTTTVYSRPPSETNV